MNTRLVKTLSAVALSLTLTQGCVPILVGGVAAAGYMTAQERGAKTAVMDTKIMAHIKDRLTAKNYKLLTQVEVEVLQGNVLLTGVVSDQKTREEVEKVVRSVPDVKSVYNELFSDGIYPSKQYAEDSYVLAQLKGRMLAAKDVFSINYMIKVVNGHAYVLGLSETQSEMERVMHIVRTTKGVKKVVNYVRIYNGGIMRNLEAPEANPIDS